MASRSSLGCLFILAAVLCTSRAGAQANHREHADTVEARRHISGQAIGLATSAWPTAAGKRLTEGYITQPFVMGMYKFPGDALTATAMLDFEGLTLQRGELTSGIWGEGYVDRRHPHTYLHEYMLEARTPLQRDLSASLAIGKGFVPFGTDDPMVRPLVKYPMNHHLAQILERFVAIAAVRRGGAVLEYSRFNGDEPQSSGDFPNLDRFADSWSTRVSFQPSALLEFQGSYAFVTSPENADASGLDQKKFSASARLHSATWYGLAEFAQTTEASNSASAFRYQTLLMEGSFVRTFATIVGRIESTERPDEERLENIFRTSVPSHDFHVLGKSRWLIVSAGALTRPFRLQAFSLVPLVEASVARPKAVVRNSVFDPSKFYGASNLWNVSVGVKISTGMMHGRMGRYGVLPGQ